MLGWNKKEKFCNFRPVINSIGLIQVDVSQRNLSDIYPDVFEYSKVQVLLASNNRLSRLSEKIENLKKLKQLDLSHNKLSFIHENVAKCSRLLHIYLQDNRLTNLPDNLYALKLLKFLRLEDNLLENLPNNLGLISSLVKLDVSRNSLTDLPESVVHLKHLVYLDLSDNAFVTFPSELRGLLKLETLVMKGNKLCALNSDLTSLKNLKIVDLSSNHFSTFPSSIGDLSHLQSLDLSSNQLTQLSSRLSKLKRLTSLNLSNNHLQHIFDNFAALQHLNINNNNLTTISLLNINKLKHLHASNNHLNDIPKGLYGLKMIEKVYLSGNKIAKITPEIGRLKSLKVLDLSNNQIQLLPKALYELGLEKLILREEDRSRRYDHRNLPQKAPAAFHVTPKNKQSFFRKMFSFKKKSKKERPKSRIVSNEFVNNVINHERNNDKKYNNKSVLSKGKGSVGFSDIDQSVEDEFIFKDNDKSNHKQYSAASTISIGGINGKKYNSKINSIRTPQNHRKLITSAPNDFTPSMQRRRQLVNDNSDSGSCNSYYGETSIKQPHISTTVKRHVKKDNESTFKNRHASNYYEDENTITQFHQPPHKVINFSTQHSPPNTPPHTTFHTNLNYPFTNHFSTPIYPTTKDFDAISTTVTVNEEVGDTVSLGDDDFEYLLEDVRDDKLHGLATELESLLTNQLLTPFCV